MVKLTHDQLMDIIEKHKYYLKNRIENIGYKADLSGANLMEANLSGANLMEANLSGANLMEANLMEANLMEANLMGANLMEANLMEANLMGANLSGVDLNNVGGIYQTLPSHGAFIGWKKTVGNLIVKLWIPDYARRSSSTGRKCRCDTALVLDIQKLNGDPANTTVATSEYKRSFKYEIDKIVRVEDFDENRFNECASGIHFFITRDEAVNY